MATDEWSCYDIFPVVFFFIASLKGWDFDTVSKKGAKYQVIKPHYYYNIL